MIEFLSTQTSNFNHLMAIVAQFDLRLYQIRDAK